MGHKNHAVFCQQDVNASGRKNIISSLVINNRKALQLNIEKLNIEKLNIVSSLIFKLVLNDSIIRG